MSERGWIAYLNGKPVTIEYATGDSSEKTIFGVMIDGRVSLYYGEIVRVGTDDRVELTQEVLIAANKRPASNMQHEITEKLYDRG